MTEPRPSLFSRAWARFRAIDSAFGQRLGPQMASVLLVASSLLCAGMMLASSWLLRGSEYDQVVLYSLLALWWIPFCVFANAAGRSCDRSGGKSD